MVLSNENESYSNSEKSKLKLFILSVFLPLIRLFKRIYEKSIIKVLEARNRIFKIENESLSDELRQSIETNIVNLYKNYEMYSTRKETYLIYTEKKRLIDRCKICLNTCSFFKNRNKLLDEPSNEFIGKSISKLSYLLKEFEGYNNESFIQERIQKYDSLFKKSPFPLDEAQKRAIVTDDTHNLVVAGAGSGKTEVLITRAAYLIERAPDKVDTKKILILAYQNKAAEEVKKRLKERFGVDDVEVRTFHSLGKSILEYSCKNSEKEIPELKFSGSNFEKDFSNHINDLFKLRKANIDFQKRILDYMKFYHHNEVLKSQEDFEDMEEFHKYMLNLKYTAFDGTKVKSEAERVILNFFLSHNLNEQKIRIFYEHPAQWMEYIDANGNKKIPKPDFFFPDYDIYLEHWAIGEDGKVPVWFEGKNASEKYKRGMERKIEKFTQQNRHLLVQTASYEFKGEGFEKVLIEKMTKALKTKYPNENFEFTPVPDEQFINRVNQECKESVKGLSFNVSRFITIAKTYNLLPGDIERKLRAERWSGKQKAFAKIALDIYEIYENELRTENKIDFADMINLAVKGLKDNEEVYRNSFAQILVDEYQDISAQRYQLIYELLRKNNGCKLFCVGDDWQSIMGFSGSNLDFFVKFEKYFDHPARTDLSMNYRSCKSIVDAGAEIIKYNKGSQTEKKASAKNTAMSPIKVYVSNYNRKAVNMYHSQVASHCVHLINNYLAEGYEAKDILILSRIGKNPMMQNKLIEFAKNLNVPISFDTSRNPNKISFMTVHKSKGLQAKVVFLLDVVEGLYGFPCELENPDIFEPAVLSRKKDKYEEERRLFYVAVTRAMNDLIIYTRKDSVSKFIHEIEHKVTFYELCDLN